MNKKPIKIIRITPYMRVYRFPDAGPDLFFRAVSPAKPRLGLLMDGPIKTAIVNPDWVAKVRVEE